MLNLEKCPPEEDKAAAAARGDISLFGGLLRIYFNEMSPESTAPFCTPPERRLARLTLAKGWREVRDGDRVGSELGWKRKLRRMRIHWVRLL